MSRCETFNTRKGAEKGADLRASKGPGLGNHFKEGESDSSEWKIWPRCMLWALDED